MKFIGMQLPSFHSILLYSLLFSPLAAAQNASTEEEPPIYLLSQDDSFHFELLLPLGEAIYGGADIGPVLGAAKVIKVGDMESFSSAFFDLANTTKAAAEDPALAYDPINVRDSWFSTATYFRRADFYLHGNWDDPRINKYWDEQIAAFDKGNAGLPIPGQRLTIPADGFDVEAIWFPASADNCTKHPTLILGNGYDGSQEDLYHTVVVPAQARGWNCLTYEGPGHPTVRRRQSLGFIYDWERVVTPLVDHLLSHKADVVDQDRLALFGYSFGGYLAARAAAFEPRLSAVLLDGGIWSAYDAWISVLSSDAIAMLDSGDQKGFDAMVQSMRNAPNATSGLRWGIDQGLWSFNTKSAYDWFKKAKDFTLEGVVDRINMPMWIADAQFEGFFSGQAKPVKDALGERATYHLFNGTAGYHCQVGALQEMNREMFAWLNRTLG